MRDVFAIVAEWLEQRRAFALATLVELREARTAPLGTTIAVDAEGRIVGNIGAGCYESEIVETAMQTLRDGALRYVDVNLDTDDEVAGGTACGAVMRVATWRPTPAFLETARAIGEGRNAVTLTVNGFERVIPAKAPLVLVGATALAAEIAAIASRAEFRVIVVDPRPAFATRERIPGADEIVPLWPDEYLSKAVDAQTAIVVLSHDPKFDLPSLRAALRSPAWYIGLLGSRRSQRARRAALAAEGFDGAALARIHGPAGLDIGGETAAETAVSIVAEMVALRNARGGKPLHDATGSIH